MYLKFNLGPLHLLDNFVKEILASDYTKSYLRKDQYKISRLVTNDLNKSRHATSGGARGAAAPPDFGRSEGAAGQRRRAALLPAPPDF